MRRGGCASTAAERESLKANGTAKPWASALPEGSRGAQQAQRQSPCCWRHIPHSDLPCHASMSRPNGNARWHESLRSAEIAYTIQAGRSPVPLRPGVNRHITVYTFSVRFYTEVSQLSYKHYILSNQHSEWCTFAKWRGPTAYEAHWSHGGRTQLRPHGSGSLLSGTLGVWELRCRRQTIRCSPATKRREADTIHLLLPICAIVSGHLGTIGRRAYASPLESPAFGHSSFETLTHCGRHGTWRACAISARLARDSASWRELARPPRWLAAIEVGWAAS